MGEFHSGRYLTFRVGRQEFAVESRAVRAILQAHEVFAIDNPEPPWITGHAMLRGQPVAVMDLRLKLGLKHGVTGRYPSVIVIDCGNRLLGIAADAISEVIHARAHDFSSGKLRIGRPRVVLDAATLLESAVTL